METIKLGSSGESVKTLQKKLGITADGDFGKMTEAAVKKFQAAHNLTADGVVGAKTWKALGVEDNTAKTNNKCVDDCVVYSPLSTHISQKANKQNKYIVLHYTAGRTSEKGGALSTKNVFIKRSASSDFVVDDETILQLNPDLDKYYTWHCGDAKNKYSSGGQLNGKCLNSNSIGIEICSNLKEGASSSAANHEGWTYSDKELNNVVKLVKILMKKYNIPVENVVRHYDVTGKICPGIIGYNNETIYTIKGEKTTKKSDSKKWEALKKRFM